MKEITIELAFVKAKGASNLIHMFVTSGQPDEARSAYDELRKLAEASYPERHNLLARQVGCRASEIIYAYAMNNRFDEARSVYDELERLAKDYPDETALLAWQAEGAFDLTYGYYNAGMLDEARVFLDQLEELIKSSNVAEVMQKTKIEGIPKTEWLRRTLQTHSGS